MIVGISFAHSSSSLRSNRLSPESQRQTYNERSRVIVDEYVKSHPDSEFVINYLAHAGKRDRQKSKKAAGGGGPAGGAEGAEGAKPEGGAVKLLNKKLELLKPNATSTPKKPPEEEDESDDESGSDSDE